MPLRAISAALVFAVASNAATASDIVGYSEAFDTLFQVNLSNHTAVELGPAGYLNGQRIADVEGLSYAPNGQLYAVSDDLKGLLRISAQTGRATYIGALNLTNEPTTKSIDLGMAITCEGRFFLSAGDGNVWEVDPNSGAARFIGNAGVKITGMAARGKNVYATGSQGNNNLYLIDTQTAAASLLGAYNTSTYVTTVSPGFDASGKLWGVLNYVPPQPGSTTIPPWSDAASIDSESGALKNTGSIIGPIDLQTQFFGELKGLAITVPTCDAGALADATPALSPQALGLFAGLLALVGAAGTRLRRRRPTR